MAKTITDLLLDVTINIMADVVNHYEDRLDEKGICKILERGIGKRLSPNIPDMYTEVEVKAVRWADSIKIAALFMIDEEVKEVARHEVSASYDPTCMNEEFRSHPVSMGVSSRGITFEDVPATYELKDKPDGYWFGTSSDTSGEGVNEETDLDYFRNKVMLGLGLPTPPTDCAPMTVKTAEPVIEKPYIDFTSISSLSPVDNDELPRFTSNAWVGVDMAKYEAVTTPEEDVEINRMAIEIRDAIDKQIIDDLVCEAAKVPEGEEKVLTYNDIAAWAVPTGGWSREVTNWDNPLGTTITTNNQSTIWFNPYAAAISSMEEISFTEDELDELIDLIHDCRSEVMKFK